MQTLLRSAAHGSVAVSGYEDTEGNLRAHALVPLLDREQVVFALPYADAPTAWSLENARGDVVLVLADGRMAGRAWAPVAAAGRIRVVDDPRGERFRDSLIVQELRKYPPSRALIDSPLLCREHWWYLPRLLAVFEPRRVWPVEPLQPDGGVLVWRTRTGLDAATVAVEGGTSGWEGPEVVLVASPSGCEGSRVVLCRHDFSVPDREVASTLGLEGVLNGRRLRVERRQGRAGLPPAPGLLARMRRQRALERGCRAGLAAAGV